MNLSEKFKDAHDKFVSYMPVSEENKESAANALGTAVVVAGAYGIYKIISNRKSRSRVSSTVRNFSNSISNSMGMGRFFGKRRRSRKGSKKASKKQKKMRRSRH